MAAVSCVRDRRPATAAYPGLVGEAAGRRARAGDHERGPRRVQFQGQARVRLAATLCELAGRLPERPCRLGNKTFSTPVRPAGRLARRWTAATDAPGGCRASPGRHRRATPGCV